MSENLREEPRYKVQPGDTLAKIAKMFYGKGNMWRKIYEHPDNKERIGEDPDFIPVGLMLTIPPKGIEEID